MWGVRKTARRMDIGTKGHKRGKGRDQGEERAIGESCEVYENNSA